MFEYVNTTWLPARVIAIFGLFVWSIPRRNTPLAVADEAKGSKARVKAQLDPLSKRPSLALEVLTVYYGSWVLCSLVLLIVGQKELG